MRKTKVYLTCSVNAADDKIRNDLEAYVSYLEDNDYDVYYPQRDTKQDNHGFDICLANGIAIQEADEVHLFYNPASKGSHFDLGMLFAMEFLSLGKKRVFKVVEGKDKTTGEWGRLFKKWEDLRNE